MCMYKERDSLYHMHFPRLHVYPQVLWRNIVKRLYRCKIGLHENGSVYKKRHASRRNNLRVLSRTYETLKVSDKLGGRERLPSFSFPPRNLNSGKTSLVSVIVKPAALPPQGCRGRREKEGEDEKWHVETPHRRRRAIATSGIELGCREFMLIRLSLNFRVIKLNWLPSPDIRTRSRSR